MLPIHSAAVGHETRTSPKLEPLSRKMREDNRLLLPCTGVSVVSVLQTNVYHAIELVENKCLHVS